MISGLLLFIGVDFHLARRELWVYVPDRVSRIPKTSSFMCADRIFSSLLLGNRNRNRIRGESPRSDNSV